MGMGLPFYPDLHDFRGVPFHVWMFVSPVLPKPRPPRRRKADRKGGRPRASDQLAFSAILWKLRSGGTWNRLPKRFGSRTTALRRLQRWLRNGLLEMLFRRYLEHCGDREFDRTADAFAAQRERRDLFWVYFLELEYRSAAARRPQKRVEKPSRWALPSSPAGEKA